MSMADLMLSGVCLGWPEELFVVMLPKATSDHSAGVRVLEDP